MLATHTRILNALLCCTVALCSCSSVRIIKRPNEHGQVKELAVMGAQPYTLVFDYYKNRQIRGVAKFIPSSAHPVLVRRFYYYSTGALRLQTYDHALNSESGAKDSWVESYFFDQDQLTRTETAFKSPYSISRHKTPYLRTLYTYDAFNRPLSISINAGTFATETRLQYLKRDISSIEYTVRSYRSAGALDTSKQYRIRFEDGRPVSLRDMKGGITTVSREEIDRIISEERILEPLHKIKSVASLRNLAADMEREVLE